VVDLPASLIPVKFQEIAMAEIRVPSDYWTTRLLPQGSVEAWLVGDGALVKSGQPLAMISIEDAKHEVVAPCSGKLKILYQDDAVFDPGAVIGVVADSAS
jgi:pyruvate/2-oxoglutarate dehydrogenase complex dihydrolipoamide acyltransferase (E2) component